MGGLKTGNACFYDKRSFSGALSALLFVFCIVSEFAHSAAPVPRESLEELVARQLIVLFQPEGSGNYSADSIVGAARNPSANAQLHARLGNPVAAAKMLEGMTSPEMQRELAERPWTARARLEQYVVLTYPSAASAKAAKARLEQDAQVLSVEQNFLMSYSATPTDRYFSKNLADPAPGNYQWGMQSLNLPEAWEKVRGRAFVGAADSGVAFVKTQSDGTLVKCDELLPSCVVHPDLQQNFRPQFSRNLSGTGDVTDVLDIFGHGTHVAGIVAATPQYAGFGNHSSSNTGVAGACFTCSYAAIRTDRTFNTFGAAVTYALDHGLQAVNMSWGDQQRDLRFQSCNDGHYHSFCDAIEHAKERDVVLVAAAGNNRENRVAFPARSPDVIAVGGLQLGSQGPVYWADGYGQSCEGGVVGQECGSNYGPELTVMAPAKDIVSTYIPGLNWSWLHCGDEFGPDLGLPTGQTDGYGDCTGTSMSAPHITGLVGLIRSANPLLTRDQVKTILVNSSQPCIGSNSDRCHGAGIPDASKAVSAALGSDKALNRLTPLFGFYSSSAEDHFYTTVPQMARAALSSGGLLPQPAAGGTVYAPVGAKVPTYSQFPNSCQFGPCAYYPEPRAIASVFVSHVNPIAGGPELVPLYRYSWACTLASCTHASHVYSTDPAAQQFFTQEMGYQFDGIEGYIYPKTQAQPSGTVKLCRKYDAGRDDYVLFPDMAGNDCAVSPDAYINGGNYGSAARLSDWLGWVHPEPVTQAICAGGKKCNQALSIPLLLLLLLE